MEISIVNADEFLVSQAEKFKHLYLEKKKGDSFEIWESFLDSQNLSTTQRTGVLINEPSKGSQDLTLGAFFTVKHRNLSDALEHTKAKMRQKLGEGYKINKAKEEHGYFGKKYLAVKLENAQRQNIPLINVKQENQGKSTCESRSESEEKDDVIVLEKFKFEPRKKEVEVQEMSVSAMEIEDIEDESNNNDDDENKFEEKKSSTMEIEEIEEIKEKPINVKLEAKESNRIGFVKIEAKESSLFGFVKVEEKERLRKQEKNKIPSEENYYFVRPVEEGPQEYFEIKREKTRVWINEGIEGVLQIPEVFHKFKSSEEAYRKMLDIIQQKCREQGFEPKS